MRRRWQRTLDNRNLIYWLVAFQFATAIVLISDAGLLLRVLIGLACNVLLAFVLAYIAANYREKREDEE